MAIASINLSNLNGSNGFALNGIAGGAASDDNGDLSGRSVSGAGDINGDGIDDVIIGAPLADPNGTPSAGQSYVVFGSRSGFSPSLNLSSLNGRNGFAINGINQYDQSGSSVSGAGDINGDGIDDLIIGAPVSEFNGNGAGQSYIVFGSRSGFSPAFNLNSLNGSNGFAINGIALGDGLGGSVSGAGDINGDGIDDVIIGARNATANGNASAGQSYVIFGSRSGFNPSINVNSLNGSNGFAINGINRLDYSGFSVSGAGDINGDGIDDLIIGATSTDVILQGADQCYVVFGSRNGFGPAFNLSSLNGRNGFTLNSVGLADNLGISVSRAGDINGDGIDDLIVGASGANPNGKSNAGQSYVVFGSRSGFSSAFNLSSLNGRNGFAINGVAGADNSSDGDYSGGSVSAAGDVNGDGVDDLIVGADRADANGKRASGQSYVIFGSRNGFNSSIDLGSLNGSNGYTINGIAPGDDAGHSVSGAGDINGDGVADLVIGADSASPNGNYRAGQSYAVFGVRGNTSPIPNPGNTTPSPTGKTKIGSNRADVLRGTQGNDSLIGKAGNDRLLGGDGNDVLNGGQGKDTLQGGNGSDTLVGGRDADRLTGGAGADTFVLKSLKDSFLSRFDRITDLTSGVDQIDAPAIAARQVVQRGKVRQLSAAKIAAVLTPQTFVANSVATFTVGSGQRQRTFLALNNGTAGFSAKTDAVVDITGYSGSLANLAIG